MSSRTAGKIIFLNDTLVTLTFGAPFYIDKLNLFKKFNSKLFAGYVNDEELRSDIRFQPILFFRELLVRNMSVLELIDSRYSIGTSNLAKHFAEKLAIRGNASKPPH